MNLRPTTRFVGNGFFRLVRMYPWVFQTVCLFGVWLGYFLVFETHDPNPRKAGAIRYIGYGCFVFNSWLIGLWLHKLLTGTWRVFCDWAIGIFV